MSQQSAEGMTAEQMRQRVDDTWSRLNALVDQLSEEQLTTPGPEGWTIRDHLAHIAAWERALLAILAGRSIRGALGVPQDDPEPWEIDRVNQHVYERNQDRSLDDVLDDLRRTHEEVTSALANLDTEDIEKPFAHYQPEDPRDVQEPVIGAIAANTYEHYEEHIPWMQTVLERAQG